MIPWCHPSTVILCSCASKCVMQVYPCRLTSHTIRHKLQAVRKKVYAMLTDCVEYSSIGAFEWPDT